MTFSKTILIDGDSIAYKCAWAESSEEMKVSLLKSMGSILTNCKSNKYELYIEEWRHKKHIFRAPLAVTKSYKGNRKPPKDEEKRKEWERYMERVKVCRQMMVDIFHANVVDDMESEDYVLIRAYEIGINEVIIAYIDKDLLQYPLMYYNYNKETFTTLTEEQATFNLWAQVLTGDSTDNIPGLKGYGPAKAKKALLDHKESDYPMVVAMEYMNNDHDFNYFVEQYNLIKLRNKRCTNVWYPITKEQWENI